MFVGRRPTLPECKVHGVEPAVPGRPGPEKAVERLAGLAPVRCAEEALLGQGHLLAPDANQSTRQG
jgi:hypothetical protein